MKASDLEGISKRGVSPAQVEQCYRQLPIALAVNLANGAVLLFGLWGAFGAERVAAWYLLLLAVSFARYRSLLAFREAIRSPPLKVEIWQRRFAIGAGGAGLVWGAAGAVLFHPDSFPHQVFLAFVLGGMVAGAIPVLSAVRHAYAMFAVPVVVSITIRILLPGDQIHLVMGLLVAVFGLAMLASSAQVHRLFLDAERLREQLSSSIEASQLLERLVRMDPLTGIPNRRMFEEQLHKEWRRAERGGEPLAVISADIDHFKEYNDHYGHPAGDRCLMAVAQAMRRALARPGDVVARIGGEEFAVLLPGTSSAGARSVAEQVRAAVLALNLPHEASPVCPRVSVSFGVAATDAAPAASAAELMRASDVALYDAKRNGRNQVAVMTKR